ncbi:PREDICTED: trafficking protein particle complex subunit 6A [Propithecus coquereli]|uniref:trafficking protein particle complex subunit 6A n=1 Tax=Propithecus coquereli TaxID=379532 RepID=UPI00063FB922|nr:PREDICTED: trafficking protein particle complex subunit 6A [Propithecus coquereli]
MAVVMLFQFLHAEMVAELGARDTDPGPGAAPGHAGLQGGAGCPKVLCKDLWVAVFQKQMDGLCTNHQGTYVLQDNSVPLLIPTALGLQYLEDAPKFLAFTCGLLRGTLRTLGFQSLVTSSVATLPACKFQVVVRKSGPQRPAS